MNIDKTYNSIEDRLYKGIRNLETYLGKPSGEREGYKIKFQEVRDRLNQKFGKENVSSNTIPETARSSRISRTLRTGETVTVIGEKNNKAVEVRSKPDKNGNTEVIANIPYDQRGLPIFDDVSKFTTKIEKPQDYKNMSNELRRKKEMINATLALREEIRNGRVNRNQFTPKQLEDIEKGKHKIRGYTWHHNAQSSPNNMQLVPESVHKAVQHIGEGALSEGR